MRAWCVFVELLITSFAPFFFGGLVIFVCVTLRARVRAFVLHACVFALRVKRMRLNVALMGWMVPAVVQPAALPIVGALIDPSRRGPLLNGVHVCKVG